MGKSKSTSFPFMKSPSNPVPFEPPFFLSSFISQVGLSCFYFVVKRNRLKSDLQTSNMAYSREKTRANLMEDQLNEMQTKMKTMVCENEALLKSNKKQNELNQSLKLAMKFYVEAFRHYTAMLTRRVTLQAECESLNANFQEAMEILKVVRENQGNLFYEPEEPEKELYDNGFSLSEAKVLLKTFKRDQVSQIRGIKGLPHEQLIGGFSIKRCMSNPLLYKSGLTFEESKTSFLTEGFKRAAMGSKKVF